MSFASRGYLLYDKAVLINRNWSNLHLPVFHRHPSNGIAWVLDGYGITFRQKCLCDEVNTMLSPGC